MSLGSSFSMRAPVDRVRVLHLIPTLSIGGAERQLVTLLRSFNEATFEHHVGVLTRSGKLAEELGDLPVQFVEFGFRYRNLIPSILRIVRYLREHEINVVHAHLHLAGVVGRIAARRAGIQCTIYTEHSDVSIRPWFWRRIEKSMLPLTYRKITVSDAQREATILLEGFEPSRVVTIDNSIQTTAFEGLESCRAEVREELGLAADCVVIGNVAVQSAQKRLDRLLHAFHSVVARGTDCRLVLVGDGPEHDALIALTHELGLGASVVFTGARQDVPRLLASMDIFAITSRWEGLPINLLEAMASGLAIASVSVGGISDVLRDGETGRLLEEWSVKGFTEVLEELIEDSDLRERLGSGAKEYVGRHHDSSLNARRVESLYIAGLSETAR